MRISRPQMWIEVAGILAKRSTCYRGNVGALLVDPSHTNVLSSGYNGPPSGEDHCAGNGCSRPGAGCHRSVHAEVNALNRSHVTQGCHLYVTLSPCLECAKAIHRHGVSSVTYGTAYRDSSGVLELLNHGVNVYRLTASGYLIDEKTQEIVNA